MSKHLRLGKKNSSLKIPLFSFSTSHYSFKSIMLRHYSFTVRRARKWVSERCERMSEQTSEWLSTFVSILVCSEPQCVQEKTLRLGRSFLPENTPFSLSPPFDFSPSSVLLFGVFLYVFCTWICCKNRHILFFICRWFLTEVLQSSVFHHQVLLEKSFRQEQGKIKCYSIAGTFFAITVSVGIVFWAATLFCILIFHQIGKTKEKYMIIW